MFLGEEERLVDKNTLWHIWMVNQMVELEVKGINLLMKKGITWFIMKLKSEGIEIARKKANLDATVDKYKPHISMYIK